MTEEEPIYVRYVRLTPKGKEILAKIMTIVEKNIDVAAKGLDQMVEDVHGLEEKEE